LMNGLRKYGMYAQWGNSHKKEWNYVICRKMDGTRDHHVKWISQNGKHKDSMFFLIYGIQSLKMDNRI
jgi:hypothetical protein